MRQTLRRLSAGMGCCALLAAGLLAVFVAREYRRDPMPLVDLPLGPVSVREAVERPMRTSTGERRRLVELVIDGVPEGPLRAALSLPETGDRRPTERLPVVVILGGLEVGRDSLRYVEAHGGNALVAYEYPRPSKDLYEGAPLFKLHRIRRASLAVPTQVRALLAWISAQPWADPARVSLLGYSFGAMFVPAAARVAEAHGIPLRSLVMAYGGADLPALLAANSSLRPAWLRPVVAKVVGAVVRPLEPALHLPYLRGEALFITGLRDRRVPLACSRLMQVLKPPPKSVLDLDEGHMDPSLPDLNRRIVTASQEWLRSRGAMAR